MSGPHVSIDPHLAVEIEIARHERWLDPDPLSVVVECIDPDCSFTTVHRWPAPRPPRRVNRLGLVAIAAAAAALLIAGVAIGRASAAPRSGQTTTPQPGASGAIGSVDGPARATASTSAALSGAPLVEPPPALSAARSAASEASGAPSPDVELGTAIAGGLIAYADPGLGDRYLAIPSGPGHRVRICAGSGTVSRCLERTSTDAGPALFEQRAGRIADVSFVDFAWLCACNPQAVGLIHGSIEWLDGPTLTAPPTDVGDAP